MIIKPKFDMSFVGAKSGYRTRLVASVLKEIDPEEVKHLDPADFDVVSDPKAKDGDVVPPPPAPATKKKK